MKQKWTIALVAILTFTLILSGCAVLPQSAGVNTDVLRPYGGNDIHTEDDAYDYGARGRAANIDDNSVPDVSNGGYGGNGAGARYTDDCDPIYDGATTADPNYALSEEDKDLSLTGYGSTGALDDTSLSLADMLTYAIQDEYLAHAEYDLILSTYGNVRPFTNIIRAEQTHIDTLLPLFAAYGIAAPADEGENKTASVTSLTQAYQAGVNAEVNNIAMYETFLDQNLPDNVRAVFESLMRASENHLRAFQNRL